MIPDGGCEFRQRLEVGGDALFVLGAPFDLDLVIDCLSVRRLASSAMLWLKDISPRRAGEKLRAVPRTITRETYHEINKGDAFFTFVDSTDSPLEAVNELARLQKDFSFTTFDLYPPF